MNRNAARLCCSIAALGGALLASTVAHATTQDRLSFEERLVRAELVFEGKVLAIDHRESDVLAPGEVALPHTFVTFSIERVFKGSCAGTTMTLRFLGGPDRKGRTLEVEGTPSFQAGDHDILFVRGNGTSACPIVGMEGGRLRLVRGAVFDHFGHELWISREGELIAGETKVDPDAALHPLLAPKLAQSASKDRFVPPAGALLPDADGLRAVLQAAVAALAPAALEPTRSVRIDERFSVPAPRRARPPASAAKH